MAISARQPRLRSDTVWPCSEVIDLAATPARPVYQSEFGVLFGADCLSVLPAVLTESIDTIFADPPFNLGKDYGKRINDSRPDSEYLNWCQLWLRECVRTLKPGGALFLYNIPRWNIQLGAFLMAQGMTFRHDIAVNIKFGLPIAGRLYPSHYSLLYFTKGKPKTFRNIRTPIETCRHCGKELKDYGGHRDAMNPRGVNLTDVWNDIPPVRHRKFKSDKRRANQLSTKLVRRCIELSTVPGEVVLDPFGGSGTTFDVCEHLSRHWVGIELEFADAIIHRLESLEVEHHASTDRVDGG